MKKTVRRLLTAALFSSLLSPVASACVLKIESGQEHPQKGSEDTITVQFIQIHRNCSVPPEKTEIDTKNIEVLEQSEWKPVKSNVYESTFRVKYEKEGRAVFTAERSCPKKGAKTQELEINVD